MIIAVKSGSAIIGSGDLPAVDGMANPCIVPANAGMGR
jgi:hypothetical protein